MKKAEQIIKDTKRGVLEQIKDKLFNCDNEEIYFHDIMSEEIDSQTPQERSVCLELIDLCGEPNFDEGMIDRSSLDRTLITSAYCSIEDILFNDDFIQYLQSELNNEKISKIKAKNINDKINEELKKMGLRFSKPDFYEDNNTQIFIKTSFSVNSLTKEDFIKYGLKSEQVIDLSDSIKILTSNVKLNQNAIVIEEKKRDVEKKNYLLRVYLMDKSKGLDIRNLFKLKCISAETGFNLNPSAYLEQTTEQYEQDKNFYKNKSYLSFFNDKTSFIKQIVDISNKLTETY
ncbi:MAG: hypothetical protein M0R17_05610 [Candidatus Omnitrophica bacterium]|jgi:hypothetical protein|nr:hypothetical protein [Candidatus Omnitrophota bacterium]